jgi:hypothetical protein
MKTITNFFHHISLIFQGIFLFGAFSSAIIAAFSNDFMLLFALFAFFLGSLQLIDALVRSFVFFRISKYFLSHFVFGLIYACSIVPAMIYMLDEKLFSDFMTTCLIALFFVIIPTLAGAIYLIVSQDLMAELKVQSSEFV